MVRIAAMEDAEQLVALNREFNGEGEAAIDHVRKSLEGNRQEIVIVDERDGRLTGFLCVQLKRSFCYEDYMPEITEVYVRPPYRRKGIAGEMIAFAEAYCGRNYPVHRYELLTGQTNAAARALYDSLGYTEDGEVHLEKYIERC